MLVVNSCKKDVPVDPTDNVPMLMNNQIIPENVMPAFDADQVTVNSNIESDISCYPDLFITDPTSNVNDRMGAVKVIDIIKRMKLTDRQLAAIRTYMVGYHECVKDVMTRTEAQRQKAIERAKAAREDVIARFKAGEIDRARAAAKIAEINKALRASLETLINKDALCECLKALYSKIRATLTDEQKAMWDKWVANQKLPCVSVRSRP
jgi:DNA-binding transcriptional MerR regulator